MKSICVFCGSSLGTDPSFTEAARELGRTLSEQNITLIYGGANRGIMGLVADSVLENNGRVIGVLPKFLRNMEVAHTGLTELILCDSMHERKTKMFELSEGFLALPGGFGTLEEVIEILTWHQLGLHKFPVGLLNINGFYNPLIQLFDQMEASGLLKTENKDIALFGETVTGILGKMHAHQAAHVSKWIPTQLA
jgi:uncharacterized protein (TIGR00730 family)